MRRSMNRSPSVRPTSTMFFQRKARDTQHALAELGALILLFEVGLESDLDELLRAGVQAVLVALVGVVVPFASGFGVMRWFDHPPLLAVFVGATPTATSVGVTVRVLADLGRLPMSSDERKDLSA